ncbi:MAG: iron-sulfur cluster assembly scaffold protein [Promethearchaeota archaeon]|nr:MAG: iron-sulfur cluster assembly scaffold protein [Candidatus Lokiarchaeota archaeon]
MSEDFFDDYAKKLEEMIKEKAKEDYNEYIVDLFYDPKNWGKPPDNEISISQSYKGPCNDTMTFYLNIKNDIIEKANFITDGCGATVATASQVTLLIEGKSLEFAENLTAEDIDKALGGLPEDHKHCAELSATTLKKAINKYRRKVYQIKK